MTDTFLSIDVNRAGPEMLPPGYSMRPATMADIDDAVQMMNAWSRHAIGREKFNLEDVLREWQEPGYDLQNDSCLLIDDQGQIVGFEEVFDPGLPHARIYCWGVIEPQLAGLGMESRLLDWAEKRARLSICEAPLNARIVLVSHCLSSQVNFHNIFLGRDFEFKRHSLRMVLELKGKPDIPTWPEGFSVRTMEVGRDERAVVEAVREAFRDHWGFVETPYEEEFARWKHLMEGNPDFDPKLWFLALEGDEIIGFSLCWPKSRGDIEMGWISTLGVRRPWRRRGLGLALLQHSFIELQKIGKARVGLGVDAQSLTGATRLYEKAGMRSDSAYQISIFEKELRPGEDLSTQSVEI